MIYQKKTKRELRKLETSYNKPFNLTDDEQMNINTEEEMLNAIITDTMIDYETGLINTDEKEPNTFREAWFHSDEQTKKKRREAIKKEISSMIVKQVWKDITEKKILEMKKEDKERKPIGCKWIFKI